MKYCPYCGAEIAARNSSYCAECGRELMFAQPEHRGATQQKKKKKKSKPAPEREDYDGYYDDVLPGTRTRSAMAWTKDSSSVSCCSRLLSLS